MAIIGLSKPYFAKYNFDGNTVTYSDGGLLGKAIEMSIDPEETNDSNLYADNGIAESERAFTGGTVGITTDNLSQEASKVILGIKEVETTINGSDGPIKELVYDDEQNAPYLGIGSIIKAKKNGKVFWRGVILPKVIFSIPSEAATTQGETIEWQTPELEATLMKDDTPTHVWKRTAEFETEADAEKYIKDFLKITEPVALSAGKAVAVQKNTKAEG